MKRWTWVCALLLACGGGGGGTAADPGTDAAAVDTAVPDAGTDPGTGMDPGAGSDPGTATDPGTAEDPGTAADAEADAALTDAAIEDTTIPDPGALDPGVSDTPLSDADATGMVCANPVCTDGHCTCDCAADEGLSEYECPDGTKVLRCACSALGVRCIDRPEYLCPTLCSPGDEAPMTCPDGSTTPCKVCQVADCVPVCGDGGWVDSCTGKLLKAAECAGCQAVCDAIGSKSEGWYDTCGGLIGWEACGPRWIDANDDACGCAGSICTLGGQSDFRCPGGETIGWCECVQPDGLCPPVCDRVGTAEEGWYDACSQALVKAGKCDGCAMECGAIGSKSEGWYSSCDGLITWAPCGTGLWDCKGSPWELCAKAAECVPENGYIDPAVDWRTCCPGLSAVEASVALGGATCDLPGCDCHVCTYCGDGVCKGAENACNCPGDCPGPGDKTGILEPCLTSLECAAGLECVGRMDGVGTGICTRACDLPGTSDGSCADAPGSVCAIVPGNGGQRYCSIACTDDAPCPSPMQCKGADADLPGIGTCIEWTWECDPLYDLYCAPGQQCRVPAGQPVCGAPGTLAKNEKCEKGAGDACGPGLVCGSLGQCWPVCTTDNLCQDAWGLDFCYVPTTGADDWGWCMFLE